MRIAAIGGGQKEQILAPIVDSLEVRSAVIIPSACTSPEKYDKTVTACTEMLGRLGLEKSITVFHGFDQTPSSETIDALAQAGLTYVIGGNTPYLHQKFAEHGTSDLLRRAVDRDMWLTGTSAGAILSFEEGQSCPVTQPEDVEWEFTYPEGLGLIKAAASVHANVVAKHPRNIYGTRFDHFAPTSQLGFGIENNAALVMDGATLRVGRSTPEAAMHVMLRGEAGEIYTRYDVRDDEWLTEMYAQHRVNTQA